VVFSTITWGNWRNIFPKYPKKIRLWRSFSAGMPAEIFLALRLAKKNKKVLTENKPTQKRPKKYKARRQPKKTGTWLPGCSY
jgi:hypothetical protein